MDSLRPRKKSRAKRAKTSYIRNKKMPISVLHSIQFCHGLRTPNERFFYQISQISCEVFQGIYIGQYCLLKSSLVCDFALLSHFFCKKIRFSQILQDFLFGYGFGFGFGLQIIWYLIIMCPQSMPATVVQGGIRNY